MASKAGAVKNSRKLTLKFYQKLQKSATGAPEWGAHSFINKNYLVIILGLIRSTATCYAGDTTRMPTGIVAEFCTDWVKLDVPSHDGG